MKKATREQVYKQLRLDSHSGYKSTSIARRYAEMSLALGRVKFKSCKEFRKYVKSSRDYSRKYVNRQRWDLLKPGNYICDCSLRHKKIKEVELSYNYYDRKNKPTNANVISEDGYHCDWRDCGTYEIMRESQLDNCPSCQWAEQEKNEQ